MGAMLRTRRWLGGLAFAMLAAAVCAFLGHWQWDKSQAPGGDLQNFAYAFNWWLFAVLCVGVWGKALRDESRRFASGDHSRPGRPPMQRPTTLATGPLPAAALATPAAQMDDPELAEWNQWLSRLHTNERR